jgi:hypothetical protein
VWKGLRKKEEHLHWIQRLEIDKRIINSKYYSSSGQGGRKRFKLSQWRGSESHLLVVQLTEIYYEFKKVDGKG